MKTLIILPDGTEISSGPGLANTIRATTITESVNRGTELTIGSTCSAMFEATLLTPGGALDVTSGDEISVFSVDDSGDRHPEGVFILERPTRETENTLKITGFDRISKLDKDLTAWLSSLDGWPYPLLTFAEMVCNACGVNLITESVPNSGFLVQRITQQLTGRKLMEWIGEICGCFCRATPTGDVELSWYKFNDIEIGPSGKNYYFLNGLSFEDYSVAPVDAVQLRLSSTEDGALFPEVADGSNSYVITGNQLLLSAVNTDLLPVLDVILDNLRTASYTPCKISVPASLEVRAGDVVKVTNLKGREIYTAVMTTVKKGNKRSLESTGSARRDSSTAKNNKSVGEIAGQKANEAVSAQSQKAIFDKLTNNGQMQGIYMKDGMIYINASYIKSGVIISEGKAYLPPTYDDVVKMTWSLSFPQTYPPQDFYDLNGDGVFNINDVRLANNVYLGITSLTSCKSIVQTPVSVKINPFDAEKTVELTGINMWGSSISMAVGVTGSNIPRINGDCNVSGVFSVGDTAVIPKLSTAIGGTARTVAWKDNGDGTFTLVGT